MAVVNEEELLSIGEFAALTRLSIKALRLYDDNGLLSPAHVDPASSYRYYRRNQRNRAILIGDLRRVDVPLALIAQILDGDAALPTFQNWWITEEERHVNRRGLGLYIKARLRREGQPPMDIQTRTVPERKLAVISKELFQPQLEEFIMSAFHELFSWAERNPGLRSLQTTREDPTYAIFHGPVTADASALVEVCIVIDGPAEPEGRITLKREPEHEEAFTTLTREGIEFPNILAAYDAVAMWVVQNGSPIEALPSREVYFADVINEPMDAEVCDIAYPYVPNAK
ncbi:MerR family transcriptional regulator [Demequina sp.]|uniref:MerR family transcriptional regulator n=1 Tax=Demequina sp. TaxID=2050685 RepID=UPI003D0EAB50